MFTLSEVLKKHLRPKGGEANAHGFNCAMLGLDKVNPYPIGSIDHKQFEWGWEEGNELAQKISKTSIYNPNPGDNEHV